MSAKLRAVTVQNRKAYCKEIAKDTKHRAYQNRQILFVPVSKIATA
jgi:hypothetical protein